jgi:tRNA(Arg) A34 adenosine deaminase TadA
MENTSSDYFMKRAIELALKNVRDGNGGPFAAIIVKDNEIVSEGVNSVHPNNDPTAHAEIVAIRKACEKLNDFQLKECELYTTCEPCPMCLGAIYWARPEKVFYASTKSDAALAGFDDSFIYDEISLPMESRKIPMFKLLREDSLQIFEEWNQKENKLDY